MPPAYSASRAGVTPEASGHGSSGTLAKKYASYLDHRCRDGYYTPYARMLWNLLFYSQLDIYARCWKQHWCRSSQLVVALSWHCNIFYACWPSVHTFIPRNVASVGFCRQDMAGISFLSHFPFTNSILYLPIAIRLPEGYCIGLTARNHDLLGKLDFTW